jgi:DNA-binding GntR family transcriptional regulator
MSRIEAIFDDDNLAAGVNIGMFHQFSRTDPTLSLSDQIGRRLAERILGDYYRPGDRILEQQLAVEFAVSRGPIREALRILEREGLVEINSRRGAQVTNLSIAEVNDLFNIRSSLLGLAAHLTAERHYTAELDALGQSIEKLELTTRQVNALSAYLRMSYETSFLLAELSGNERLKIMISSFALQAFRYTRLGLFSSERRAESLRSWQELFTALRTGNSLAAEKIAQRLVVGSRNMAITRLLAANDLSVG